MAVHEISNQRVPYPIPEDVFRSLETLSTERLYVSIEQPSVKSACVFLQYHRESDCVPDDVCVRQSQAAMLEKVVEFCPLVTSSN